MRAGRDEPASLIYLARRDLEQTKHGLVEREGLGDRKFTSDDQAHGAVVGELRARRDEVLPDAILERRRRGGAGGVALVAEELRIDLLQAVGNVARIVERSADSV